MPALVHAGKVGGERAASVRRRVPEGAASKARAGPAAALPSGLPGRRVPSSTGAPRPGSGSVGGQKVAATGQCNAPPSSANQQQFGSISLQRWTGCHAPRWARAALGDCNRAGDVSASDQTSALRSATAARASARARGSRDAGRRTRDQCSRTVGGALDARRVRQPRARASVASSGTTTAGAHPTAPASRASLPRRGARGRGSRKRQ